VIIETLEFNHAVEPWRNHTRPQVLYEHEQSPDYSDQHSTSSTIVFTPQSTISPRIVVMLLKTFFLVASIGAALAAPTIQLGARKNENLALLNTRFAKYEAEKRDATEAGKVINSRFAKYEAEKRDDEPAKVINSRFAKYEAEKRDTEAGKVINSRFAKYQAEE
jgi:hypothetical protein